MATAVLAAGLGLAAVLQWRAERSLRAEVVAGWEESGAAAGQPAAAERARRDPDPLAGRIALARWVLADTLRRPQVASPDPTEAAEETRRRKRRLALAEAEAAATLLRRPASWEAALVVGGSRLLAAASSRGDDLYARPERWQGALRHARHLAPGTGEPGRLLAMGTLASWHALSERQRAEGRDLLARELRDPVTLAQLLPAWAAAASSERELVSVLPPTARTFELLQGVERAERDWPGLCAARQRWRRRHFVELESRLGVAEHRLAVGDRAGGRRELLAVLAAAPVERGFAPLAARALDRLPAGPVTPQQGAELAAWLRWALRLWELGQQPLPPSTIDRLAGLASELGEAEVALAALAAGQLDRAELWERRADRLWSEEWAPYTAAKARALVERGERDAAAELLAQTHRTYRDRWAFRQVASRLAGAEALPPAAAASAAWPAIAWRYERGDAFLEAFAAAAASGLVVTVDVAPAGGSAIELVWDGATLGCFPASAGGLLRVPVEVTPAPHLLAVRDLGSERIAPGGVWLDAAAPDRQ